MSSIYQISRTSFFFYNIRKGGLKRRKGEGTKQDVCGGWGVGVRGNRSSNAVELYAADSLLNKAILVCSKGVILAWGFTEFR